MADNPKLPTPTMVLNAAQYQNQLLAEEVAARAEDPLDEAKREGGFFLSEDGRPVDAEGREIEASQLTSDEKTAVDEARAKAEKKVKRPAPTPAASTAAGKGGKK